MKIDPEKSDVSKLLSRLKELSALFIKRRGKDQRDWAADTSRTLLAGKLESFDLVEFAAAAYDTELAASKDPRPVWDYSRALLGLIDEMQALGAQSPKTDKIRDLLKAWRCD